MAGGGTAERAHPHATAQRRISLTGMPGRLLCTYSRRHEAVARRCFWTSRPPISTRAAGLEVWVQIRALVGSVTTVLLILALFAVHHRAAGDVPMFRVLFN